jgi:uncharacterized protein (TIGR02246 family)
MKVIALTAALAALAAPALAGDHKAQIQGYADAWMAAYNAHDTAKLVAMYTEDAVASSPTATVAGKAALTENFNNEFSAGALKFNTVTVDNAQRIGDVSLSDGSWAASMKTPDGKVQPVGGHWLVVGQCKGEDCLISRDFTNMAMAVTPASAENLRAAMEANNQAWLVAFNTPNVAAFPAMYTDDAILIPGGMAPAITGPDGISKFWENAIKSGFKDHTFEIVETRMDGNQAYLLSTWTVKQVKADGGAASISGHTLRVLAKQDDGSWKTKVHTFIPLQPQN